MKTIIMILALTFGTLSNATSLHPDTFKKHQHHEKTADLRTWDFDVDSHLRTLDVIGGQVFVNHVTKKAALILGIHNSCPPGRYCVAYIPIHKIELDIQDISVDGCGVVTYKAVRDMMPVDGIREVLTVKDNSRSMCEIIYLAPTYIDYTETYYDRINGKLVNLHSRMTAGNLESPFGE
jgi:hypothetical protein